MKRLGALSLVVFAVCGCAAAAVASTHSAARGAAGKPIIIGAAVGRTGFMVAYDGPVMNGARIAVAEINARGGVLGRPLQIVYSDSKSDVSAANTAALDVISKGAAVVITSCDYDLGGPAARAAEARNRAAFACAGSPRFGFKGVGPLAFTISNGTPTQGAVAADFVHQQGWRKPYLLNDTSFEYSKTWCQYFKQRWIQLAGAKSIVGEDTFQNSDPSVQTQVTRLKGSSVKPDVVIMCSFPPGGASAIRQLRSNGVDLPVVGTAGFDGPFWLGAVPNASSIYAVADSSVYGDDPNPKINAFYGKYKQLTGKPPTSAYPLYGYTIVQAFAAAIQKAGTTEGKAVAKAISSFKDQPLLIGPTSYTPTCHVALGRPMKIIRYANGKGSYLKTVTAGKVDRSLC